MADENEPYSRDDEIVELRLRRRRRWFIVIGALVVLGILGWTLWEGRPSVTELTIRVNAFQDDARTRRTSDFDIVINGEVTPSDLADDGARVVLASYPSGTEIALAARSTQNRGVTTAPRYHSVDPTVLPKLQSGRFGIEEVFVLGESGPSREIRVRVVDEGGQPLVGIAVHADDLFVGVTKENGMMSFPAPPAGRVRVLPMSPGHSFRPVEIVAGPDLTGPLVFARDTDATTREPSPVTVQVLDEAGQPLMGVAILVEGFERVTTQADGRAVFQITSGTLVKVEPRQGFASFNPPSQMAGPGTNVLLPFVRTRAGGEVPSFAGNPPPAGGEGQHVREFPLETLPMPKEPERAEREPFGSAEGSATGGAGATDSVETSGSPPAIDAPASRPADANVARSETASGSLMPSGSPAAESPPVRTIEPPPVVQPPPRATSPPATPPGSSSTSIAPFGRDYAAAEEHVKEHPGDDARIQFEAPASAAEHEAYGRVLWIRARGLERSRKIEEALRDYRLSYEYRPSATTAIDLFAADYSAKPCGDSALLGEAQRQATRQAVSPATREKLRAFTIFHYNCDLTTTTDPDARALAKDRLCEALGEYFDGVERGGERKFFSDIESIRKRAGCEP
jgi:hypothetical protein